MHCCFRELSAWRLVPTVVRIRDRNVNRTADRRISRIKPHAFTLCGMQQSCALRTVRDVKSTANRGRLPNRPSGRTALHCEVDQLLSSCWRAAFPLGNLIALILPFPMRFKLREGSCSYLDRVVCAVTGGLGLDLCVLALDVAQQAAYK